MADDVRERDDRFEVLVDGEVAGALHFTDGDGIRTFTHTEVDDRFQGRGLAGALVGAALEAARTAGLSVAPLCPYVRRYVASHEEVLDLVPAEHRATYDLPAA